MSQIDTDNENAITKQNLDEEINSNVNDENLLEDIEGILESVPEPQRERITELLRISSLQVKENTSPEIEIMKKLTPDHIDKVLAVSHEDMTSSYKEQRDRKIYHFLSLISIGGFFILVILLLKDIPEIMEKIIYTIGGLIAGAFGGYGVGRSKDN